MKKCKTCGADLNEVHPNLAKVLDHCIVHSTDKAKGHNISYKMFKHGARIPN